MPSPLTSSQTTTFALSGVSTIDPLLNENHYKWASSSSSKVELTYSFPWINGAYATWQLPYSLNSELQALNHFNLDSTQISSAINALQAWAKVANITFTEVADTATNVGDFRFAFSSSVGGNYWGWSSYPNNYWANAADVWINPIYASKDDWSIGSYNYLSIMHEIGHGLGLKHPGNYNVAGGGTAEPYLPTALDLRNYTIMSYTSSNYKFFDDITNTYISVYPETPMVYDIAAIQYLYGANNTTQTGNDTYRFDPSHPFYKSIWDAGGNDTIDVSNFSTQCTIDLTSGHYSSIGYINHGTGPNLYNGTNNLGIAFGAIIENAIGGSGNDKIIGNQADNKLNGGDGNDIIIGGGGKDIVDGGSGVDTIIFSSKLSNFTLAPAGTGFSIKDNVGSEGIATEINVEKLQFNDHTLTVESTPSEKLAESYRLYKAAFNRVPDYEGLGFWYKAMEHGASLSSVADSFIHSNEFTSVYGAASTDANFLTLLYQHVLGRNPDQGGYNFWINALQTDSRANVLIQFSESAENKAEIAGIISHGIIYQEYIG